MKIRIMNAKRWLVLFFPLLLGVIDKADAQKTKTMYISGRGIEDAVNWDFFCTKGMKSGFWSTIPVPSCWEQQGFGGYNYGHDNFEDRLNEEGIYRHRFRVPSEWKGQEIQIVFEGVMTDAEVKINGRVAGAIHQGAFYEFRYNISELVRPGKMNNLEVLVKKHSLNESVSLAERKADFWVFGGIFRPVYLEAKPKSNIQRIAIDSKADGSFKADVYTSSDVSNDCSLEVTFKRVGEINSIKSYTYSLDSSVTRLTGKVEQPDLWSPEFPNCYEAVFNLLDGSDKVIHTHMERIGFRTVEVRESDGVYVNGVRIKMKGVNKHTFHPKYARTSSKELSIKAVETIKDLNMNAVRMSHYPPDKHFLDVCDSLGLFVLDELTAWQKPSYDDTAGLKLLREMIIRDVNHPSIIFWDNGNEGGENDNLTEHFAKLDIQQRKVLYPWQDYDLTNTAHYIEYDYLAFDGFSKRKIFFPTEFLHGLYDGGHGAGLDDYWRRMWEDPLCAGGFLWVFQDEAIARTDKNGELDTDGDHAPDGILGPYYEREGSYYTIKDIWSPVFFERRYLNNEFNGVFKVENRYHYTDFEHLKFEIGWLNFADSEEKDGDKVAVKDTLMMALPPGQKGELHIPLILGWQEYDALRIRALDHHGKQINVWTWPVKRAERKAIELLGNLDNKVGLTVTETDSTIKVLSETVSFTFDKMNGKLKEVAKSGNIIPLSNGPVIVGNNTQLKRVEYNTESQTFILTSRMENGDYFRWTVGGNMGDLNLEVSYSPNKRVPFCGITFDYPEDHVSGMKWLGNGPYRVYKNRMKGVNFGLWEKAYNNTVTGESVYQYPEFKGYHADIYWAEIKDKQFGGFKVHVFSDDIFLRVLTPSEPKLPNNTAMIYPPGDISFLHAINAIGTKFRKADTMGPQSNPPYFEAAKIHGGRLTLKVAFVFNY